MNVEMEWWDNSDHEEWREAPQSLNLEPILYVGGVLDGLQAEWPTPLPDDPRYEYDIVDLAKLGEGEGTARSTLVALHRPARQRRRALAEARAAALKEFMGDKKMWKPMAGLNAALASTPAPNGRKYE